MTNAAKITFRVFEACLTNQNGFFIDELSCTYYDKLIDALVAYDKARQYNNTCRRLDQHYVTLAKMTSDFNALEANADVDYVIYDHKSYDYLELAATHDELSYLNMR